ncbi:MAG TPA: YbaB/EbfC family nucleoid-associated protein, partial [Nocardioides sp.]|nr:YbaB/EbfC family nucleoid-associated protein [Nocardioides sp.]
GSVGSVKVRVNGVGELVGVSVAPGAFDAADEESLSDLGDMIVAAYRDAKAKADSLASEALGPLAGGLPGAPGQPPGQLGF